MMQSMITKQPYSEGLKEDNQTCTEASSQLAIDNVSLHDDKEENTLQEEPKKLQTKLKYRKLRQKLNSMGFQHDDKCVMTKDFSSTKKQRIMKLALDLEKQIKIQNRDYDVVQMTSREISKILEGRRELDLQLLRQSRFVPALFELLGKVPSLHKAEFAQLVRGLQISLKILHIFSAVAANREYLILTNRLNGLISFGSWALGREERKMQSYMYSNMQYLVFKIINSLLLHKSKEQDVHTIIDTTVQLILCSQIFKKIKYTISEQLIQEDSLIETDLILQLLRFMQYTLRWIISKGQYDCNSSNQSSKQQSAQQSHLSKLIECVGPFIFSYFQILKQTETQISKQALPVSYPVVVESAMGLTIKIANSCFQASPISMRKIISDTKNQQLVTIFLNACCTIVRYCKHQMKEYNDNSQARSLLNQIIILLGYMSIDDAIIQKKVHQLGLLEQIFNLPVQYIMDSYLKDVSIPTFCCLINNNKVNLNLFLKDNSPQPIIKMLKKQINSHNSITKKSSTSSLISMVHIPFQYASGNYQTDRLALDLRFPTVQWQNLCFQLQKHV